MKKIVKLTESDLRQIVENVLLETQSSQLSEATYTDKVIAIQKALIKAGYSVGETGADGLYGENTKSAVMKYQKDNGIKQTGFVGSVTAAKLGVESLAGATTQAATPKSTPTLKSTPSSERQNNINHAYCNSDGGIILIKNSKLNRWKWADYVSTFKVTNAEIEIAKKSCKKTTNYSLTPRIDRELEYIKARGIVQKPFFIYDPKDNLLYLFDKGAVLVDYTQVVDGADKQRAGAKAFSSADWCTLSGLESTPHLCTQPEVKTEKDCSAVPAWKEPKWTGSYCKVNPSYGVLATQKERFLTQGVYRISYLSNTPGYSGAGKNTFSLSTLDGGTSMSAAIHGIPTSKERLEASQELADLLKKNIASGKVPKEYLNSIKAIANANQSYGCIGVPAEFIENPKVQALALDARLFVMGEDKTYLTQNSGEYFQKLGDTERCVDPVSLAKSMENMA